MVGHFIYRFWKNLQIVLNNREHTQLGREQTLTD